MKTRESLDEEEQLKLAKVSEEMLPLVSTLANKFSATGSHRSGAAKGDATLISSEETQSADDGEGASDATPRTSVPQLVLDVVYSLLAAAGPTVSSSFKLMHPACLNKLFGYFATRNDPASVADMTKLYETLCLLPATPPPAIHHARGEWDQMMYQLVTTTLTHILASFTDSLHASPSKGCMCKITEPWLRWVRQLVALNPALRALLARDEATRDSLRRVYDVLVTAAQHQHIHQACRIPQSDEADDSSSDHCYAQQQQHSAVPETDRSNTFFQCLYSINCLLLMLTLEHNRQGLLHTSQERFLEVLQAVMPFLPDPSIASEVPLTKESFALNEVVAMILTSKESSDEEEEVLSWERLTAEYAIA